MATCTACPRYLPEGETAVHRRHVRTINLVERAFEEGRCRVKVIPASAGSLKLVFGALRRARERLRRIRFSELERRQSER